jgi:hypothetical protein
VMEFHILPLSLQSRLRDTLLSCAHAGRDGGDFLWHRRGVPV